MPRSCYESTAVASSRRTNAADPSSPVDYKIGSGLIIDGFVETDIIRPATIYDPMTSLAYQEFLSAVERNLSSSRFRVSRGVSLSDGPVADLAACRTKFSWKAMVIVSENIFVRHVSEATVADFHALFDAGFLHSKHVNRVPLPRGLQFGYMVMPCLAVDAATPELIAFASSRPRKHWALFEFPVLHDLSTGQTHYYAKTAIWGASFFSDMRALTELNIARA